MVKLPLDGADVRIDVGVVVLEVVEHHGARAVVHELGALVEERRVVLVSLDDEERAATEPGAQLEVGRHAADEEARIEPGMLENPGEERGARGLAVCAGDREHPAVLQHCACQPLGPGKIRQRAFEQRFDHRLPACHDIADHHHIRCRRELRGVETLGEGDTERLELRAHWRIDVAIGAGDGEARGACDRCHPAHEGATDAEDVDVLRAHEFTGGNSANCSSQPARVCRMTSATLEVADHSSAALTM